MKLRFKINSKVSNCLIKDNLYKMTIDLKSKISERFMHFFNGPIFVLGFKNYSKIK